MGASERKVHRALLQDCSAHSLSCTKMEQLPRISTDEVTVLNPIYHESVGHQHKLC